ncbi:MAG TPA: hypothetical protein PKH05_16370, partial [Nitrospira sp.]|nr:hypothetical protein [Nitrospira sp.]
MPRDDISRGRPGLVDHKNLVVERRPVFRVLLPVDSDVRPDIVVRGNRAPPLLESLAIVRHSGPDDRHESAAVGESLEGLFDMPGPVHRVALAPNSAGGCGKRRVHHDNRRHHIGRQDVV